MPIVITGSQEWVYHDRGTKDPSLIRRYEEAAWQLLFGKQKKISHIIFKLNTELLPNGTHVVLINPKDPVDMVTKMREILTSINSNFEITLTTKEDNLLDNESKLHRITAA